MSTKRKYDTTSRDAQAQLTKSRILNAAKKLFSSKGFDRTTIDAIAVLAKVSAPNIYTLFKSKEGILKHLMDSALFGPQYQSLVEEALSFEDPVESLERAPAIARTIYDAEKNEMGLIRGASALSPQLKKLEKAQEARRYQRQENTIQRLKKSGFLPEGMKVERARDILWTFTSREVYRLLVIERGWTSDEYESWLRHTLLHALVIK